MILTVTLNPLLEKRLYFSYIELGNTHRCTKELFYPGGKGINVSKQLIKLGMQSSALTFIGGGNGKILRHLLANENIELSLVSTKSETRSASLIIEEDQNRVSTFIGLNQIISKNESAELKSKLEKMIQNCSIVIFSGSSPSPHTDEIFPYGIELAHKHDKISILDTYGSHLQKCIEAAPTALHNNVDEIESSLNYSLKSETDKIDFLNYLYSKEVKLAFLTDGANPIFASKYDFAYKITPPTIVLKDATGSGDAFTAGLAYGFEHSMVFNDFAKLATALGAANASRFDTCEVDIESAEELVPHVSVQEIGKKMKLINDSPNY
jgi:1-phosphofructokinase family hexose kinase